jgi:hypothetical protein
MVHISSFDVNGDFLLLMSRSLVVGAVLQFESVVSNTTSDRSETAMTKLSKLHEAWSKEPEYKKAYDSMHAEFELAKQLIATRIKSGLSQDELAKKWVRLNLRLHV